MAGNSLSLVWDLIARDGASPAFEKVGAAAESAAGKTEAASTKIGGGLTTAAKAAGAAGLVFAAVSVKMAADFQSSTTRLVTSANESQKNLKMVQQGMLDMAGQLGYSTEDLSAAMYKVESGGQHGAAGLATLKAAAQGAKTENADLTTVADALTSAMTDYHLKASDAATVTSKLVAATASGKMTFEELSGSLAAILPVASANHVALNDILGDLASMTMHGMSAEQASQNLADAIRHLAAPTAMQSKELAALGISSTELSASLGSKGLSGTINEVGKAITDRMGPGASQIVLQLGDAISRLPKPIQDFARGMLDGSNTVGQYRAQIKSLPPDQAAALQSFSALIGSTHQLGSETKTGGEVYQSYSGALRQAMGDATGMNVALMIGGENAGNTATAIANVSKATADAKGNVKGWSEIQGTFNQQASETVHSLEAMTIEAGMHLLPALTGAMGYVNRDAIPALKGFGSTVGSVVGDAVHWFDQLPTPVKDATLALAGLKIASSIGFLTTGAEAATGAVGRIAASLATAEGSAGRFSQEMQLQQALFAAEARDADLAAAGISRLDGAFISSAAAADTEAASLSRVQQMLRGYDTALGETAAAEDVQAASMGRFSAATATLSVTAQRAATGGVGALKSAGAGLVSFLGGPWVIGIGAAVAAVWGYNAAMDAQSQRMKDLSNQYLNYEKAQLAGGDTGQQAAAKIAGLNRDLAKAQQAYKDAADAADHGAESNDGYEQGLAIMGDQLRQQQDAIGKAKTAITEYENKLGPVGVAQAKAASAQADYNSAAERFGLNAPQTVAAAGRLREANDGVATATNNAAAATQSQIDKMNILANKQLMSADAGLAATQAQMTLSDSINQYSKDAKAGADFTGNLAEEGSTLAQLGYQTAQALANQAVKQLEANGKTDDGTVANSVMLKSLQDTASHLTGPARDATDKYIQALQGTAVNTADMSDVTGKMGLHVSAVWDNNTQVIANATSQQITDLENLGYTVMHLPNGSVVVTADTGPAKDQMQALVDSYKNYSININPQGMALTTEQRNLLYSGKAAGGPITGPGSGTSDTAGLFALSNGEHVWTAREVAAAGGHSAVEALRSSVLGMAAGGRVVTEPARFSDAYMKAAGALIARMGAMAQANAAAASFSGGASAGGNAANRALGQSIANSMGLGGQFSAIDFVFSHESGWNNLAKNPTSTAYGIAQFLDSTWATVGGHKTSDPTLQIDYGLKYMNKYGGPNGAAAFWQAHHWYDQGTNYVPSDQLAVLHKGEAVVPAAKNQGAPFMGGGPVEITGTLEIGGDGLARIINGQLVQSYTGLATTARAGVRS